MNPSDVDIRSEVRDMLTRLKHRARVAIAREDATASCPKLRRSKRKCNPIERFGQELAQPEASEEIRPRKTQRFDPTRPASTFICSQCSREYTSQRALSVHVAFSHTDPKSRAMLTCRDATEALARVRKRTQPTRALQSAGIMCFVCSDCGLSFDTKGKRRKHRTDAHPHVRGYVPDLELRTCYLMLALPVLEKPAPSLPCGF